MHESDGERVRSQHALSVLGECLHKHLVAVDMGTWSARGDQEAIVLTFNDGTRVTIASGTDRFNGGFLKAESGDQIDRSFVR